MCLGSAVTEVKDRSDVTCNCAHLARVFLQPFFFASLPPAPASPDSKDELLRSLLTVQAHKR